MKFKNPLKHLEPEKGDSLVEMMQGAFWTMLVFMLGTFIIQHLFSAIMLSEWFQINCSIK